MATDFYPLTDTLHRAVALTDDAGDIVEAYDTDAYGNTLIFDAAGSGGDWFADDAAQALEPSNDFIFTGRRYDPESEIYFYRARYYAQQQGRFVSRDLLGYIDGMNLYQFVATNPISFIDPSGSLKYKLRSSSIKNGTCGFYEISWDLVPDDEFKGQHCAGPNKRGWIVQRVVRTVSTEGKWCCDDLSDWSGDSYETITYWEAWPLYNGQGQAHGPKETTMPPLTGGRPGIDYSQHGSKKGVGGLVTEYGEMKFFCEAPASNLFETWQKGVGNAGSSQPSTDQQPWFWSLPPSNGESSAFRWVSKSWCCGTFCGQYDSKLTHYP